MPSDRARAADHRLAPATRRAEPESSTTEVSAAAAGAILTIDLGAIRANYRRLRERLGGVPCAAVVKADAYGLGAAKVGPALRDEGCEVFFVAHVSEGVELRDAVGDAPAIHVLNGVPSGAEGECAAASLTPVLNSREQAMDWSRHARRLARRLPATIQVDTGMSRLGMTPQDAAWLAADAEALSGIDAGLLMSHLACADEPDHPANKAQRDTFEALRPLFPGLPASLANSSGIFLGSAWRFDLARPGAALYGVNPTPLLANPMLPVVRLQARVVQARTVAAGAGIGYAHMQVAERPMRLATIALGYADGWHRSAAGAAFFEGVRLPFAGRVSMDSIILDISGLPEGRLKPGDFVDLFGPEQTVDDVAALAGTIGYEVLTRLGNRFHRIYLDGNAMTGQVGGDRR